MDTTTNTHLHLRQQQSPSTTTDPKTIVIILVLVIVFLIAAIVGSLWFFNRRARLRAAEDGKRQSWRQSLQSLTAPFTRQPAVRTDVLDSNGEPIRMADVEANQGVDRNTSIRSVMTLPAYSAIPRENEGVIGREGERAGIDSIVELPETNQEEEDRREEEMESLYQIRLARRREAEARASRRERRREAVARGDAEELQAIRRESQRARREQRATGSTALISEHEGKNQGRRVSTVSYGNLGVARHDGSRVRANSEESQRPLLDMAEPIRPWMSRELSNGHRRGSSSFTSLSINSYGSEDDSAWSDGDSSFETQTLHSVRSRDHSHSQSHSRARSTTQTSLRPTSTLNSESRAGDRTSSRGRSRTRENSLTDNTGQQHTDTSAEQPPPYASPVETQHQAPPAFLTSRRVTSGTAPRPVSDAPSLPEIERLPSIRVIAETPIEPQPSYKGTYPNFSMRKDSGTHQVNDSEPT